MNILHMTGLLRAIDPDSVNSIVIDDDIELTPVKPGNLKKDYRFNPGYLLYIIIRIDDGGTGLGKYVYFYVQRFRKEQALTKPEVAGMPVELKKWSAWRARGVNPGLVEYDEVSGVYVIEANFSEGQVQIEDPYKISIQYPKKESILAYGDTATLANWGSSVTVEAKIAVKEIDYSKVNYIIREMFSESFRDGVRRAFEEIGHLLPEIPIISGRRYV